MKAGMLSILAARAEERELDITNCGLFLRNIQVNFNDRIMIPPIFFIRFFPEDFDTPWNCIPLSFRRPNVIP